MKYWLFEEYVRDTAAIFTTYEEADAFRKKFDEYLLGKFGETLTDGEYAIVKVALNPSLDTWYGEDGDK